MIALAWTIDGLYDDKCIGPIRLPLYGARLWRALFSGLSVSRGIPSVADLQIIRHRVTHDQQLDGTIRSNEKESTYCFC